MKSYFSIALFALAQAKIRTYYELDDHNTLEFLEDNGYSMAQGQTAYFEVDSNPTTGYWWSISDDCKGKITIEQEYFEDPNHNGLLGVGGYDLFTLTSGDEKANCIFEIS